MNKKDIQVIKETTTQLLQVLGISPDFDVVESGEGVEIVLQTEENGMLIGYHGETLEALQLVISLAVAKALGNYVRVSLEVGEYKKNRMEYLENLVRETKERVLADGNAVSLPNLKSWERRYVHMLLQEDTEVMTESTGEGRDRVLTIYPKQ